MGHQPWTAAQRAKFTSTIASKRARGERPARRITVREELAQIRGELTDAVAALRAATRIVEQNAAPRIVEWRPNHRRQADGGTAIRAQRRRVREELGASLR